MIEARITTRSRNATIPPAVDRVAFVPFPGSPLAVANQVVWGRARWKETNEWCIVHVPTGYQLGGAVWDTSEEAMAVLVRCDPSFPAWRAATGETNDSATIACRMKFKAIVK